MITNFHPRKIETERHTQRETKTQREKNREAVSQYVQSKPRETRFLEELRLSYDSLGLQEENSATEFPCYLLVIVLFWIV